MDTFLDILVHGSLSSAVLALIAIGFSLVYGVGGIVNLAHGSFYMIGAYAAVTADQTWGLPLGPALAFGVLTAAFAGVALDRVVIRPMRTRTVTILIATLASATFLAAGVREIYGTADRGLAGLTQGGVSIFGVAVQSSRVLAFVAGSVVVGALLAVIRYTAAGRVVRAVAQDAEAATLMGVDPGRVLLIVMAVGAGLAGLAGVLVSPFEVVNPDMWLSPLTQAFAIVILGGLGSIAGTVLAAVLLGFVEAAVSFSLPGGARYVGLVSIAVILVTLVARPRGILGKGEAH